MGNNPWEKHLVVAKHPFRKQSMGETIGGHQVSFRKIFLGRNTKWAPSLSPGNILEDKRLATAR